LCNRIRSYGVTNTPKIEPSIQNLALQPLRSLITNQSVDPAKWVEEFEEQIYPPREILSVIEFFEYVISALIMVFSNFTAIVRIDKEIMEKAHNIYYKGKRDFLEKYFQGRVIDYEDFLTLINVAEYSGGSENYLAYGVLGDKLATEKMYDSLHKYSSRCFGLDSQNDRIPLHEILKRTKRETPDNYKEILEYAKGIAIPVLDFEKINNLLDYFGRKKQVLSRSQNSLVVYKESALSEGNYLVNKMINQFFLVKLENNNYGSNTDEIREMMDGNKNDLEKIILSDGDKTRELIIKKSMEITDEILEHYSSLPDEIKELSPQKLWMLARHKELIPVVKILVKNGIVKEHPEHYELVKIGKNFLAFLLWDICRLKKYKTKDTSEYTAAVFEPFNIGFGQTKLEDSARKQLNPPDGYNEFIKKYQIPSHAENSI
jgi:hypothetical protein